MKYLKFSTQAAFDTWLQEMNAIKGYDDGKGTRTYTSVNQGTDSMFYAPIFDVDIPLTEQTWESVVDDWPKPEPEIDV